MTEEEDVDVEEIVAGVIEYLDEEGLLALSDQEREQNEDEDEEQMVALSPVTGADGREFY